MMDPKLQGYPGKRREEHEASGVDEMLWNNPEKTDFYQFTVDDFRLEDYRHPFDQKIPVAE